jgi:hypothetical protein
MLRVRLIRHDRKTIWTSLEPWICIGDDGTRLLAAFTCPLCDNFACNSSEPKTGYAEQGWDDDGTWYVVGCRNCDKDLSIFVLGYEVAVGELVGWRRSEGNTA